MNTRGYIDVGGESKLMALELQETQQEVKQLRAKLQQANERAEKAEATLTDVATRLQEQAKHE